MYVYLWCIYICLNEVAVDLVLNFPDGDDGGEDGRLAQVDRDLGVRIGGAWDLTWVLAVGPAVTRSILFYFICFYYGSRSKKTYIISEHVRLGL